MAGHVWLLAESGRRVVTNVPQARLVCAAALFSVLFAGARAGAFKEAGHRSIEAEAYRRLLRDSPEVIPTLVRTGVLAVPYRGYPLPSAEMGADFGAYTVNGLVLATGKADHLLDRQLQKDLQCFHFNARGEQVTKIHGTMFGLPRGLVVDAYVECIGVADSTLRSILYAPAVANESAVGMYTMMHMVEDSYSDAHVARTPDFKYIIYLKPWNLRSWTTYFFGSAGTPNDSLRLNFSDRHHMMSDTRDFGYLLGEYDTEGCLPEADHSECKSTDRARYALRIATCEKEASALLGYRVSVAGLQGDAVVPAACLSDRGLASVDAVADLLRLVARQVDSVVDEKTPGVRRVDSSPAKCDFSQDWLNYRRKYLAHVDPRLTQDMADARVPLAPGPTGAPADVRGNFVYQTPDLSPKHTKLAGAGISTELTAGTPVWLGFDAFVASDASAHDSINPFDVLGYGVQLRLPIEDELGEKPIGVAFDIGPGIPIPLSELITKSTSHFDVYLGARARVAYSAESVFKQNTRHVIQAGLGGVSLDFVVGNYVWFGADFPRYMVRYDTWANKVTYPLSWSVSGGIATDAF